MASSGRTHPRMTLQTFAGPSSSGSPMAGDMDFALRPWPARFSRPLGHVRPKEAI
jgi:hypothetical protein